MSPEQYSGRPTKQLRVTVILGKMATMAYADGERDLALLAAVGTIKEERFESLPEMNAYIQGIQDATGFLNSLIIEG